MRRVVITGLGIVSPLGVGVDHVWANLVAGKSGLKKINEFDVSDLPCKIAGFVPRRNSDAHVGGDGNAVDSHDGSFDVDQWIPKKEQRKMDKFITFALAAGIMAVEESGWVAENEADQYRTGVLIGAGIGGLEGIAGGTQLLEEKGLKRLSPFFIPANLINLSSGFLSIKYGFKGPNHAVVTACATGTHAIGDAARLIQFGDADVMVAGGTEAAICRIGVGGFCAARALSTQFNDAPETASRPWDQDRDGFVMGEGAGVVVLEEYDHARKRGAKIYGEILGYGLSGDGIHITAPDPDGKGGYRAMEMALNHAKKSPASIDYINAHGTSTPLGDVIEHQAVKRLLGDHASSVAMSSTKSAIGHLLGAAGAVEAIFSLKAIETGVVPPTLNLYAPAEGCDMNLVPLTAQERKVDVVMSNSFGFGGTNACLVMGRV